MKNKKTLNPFVALLAFILLFAFASTMEQNNIKEDQQAQIDVRTTDSLDIDSNTLGYLQTINK